MCWEGWEHWGALEGGNTLRCVGKGGKPEGVRNGGDPEVCWEGSEH